MKPSKNYIDEKGVYHNVQNFSLTQIYDSGVEEGYRIAKQELKAYVPYMTEEQFVVVQDLCNEISTVIKGIMPQLIEIAKDYTKLDQKQKNRNCASCDRFGEDPSVCGSCEANDDE